jgi:hypothetical protein
MLQKNNARRELAKCYKNSSDDTLSVRLRMVCLWNLGLKPHGSCESYCLTMRHERRAERTAAAVLMLLLLPSLDLLFVVRSVPATLVNFGAKRNGWAVST